MEFRFDNPPSMYGFKIQHTAFLEIPAELLIKSQVRGRRKRKGKL